MNERTKLDYEANHEESCVSFEICIYFVDKQFAENNVQAAKLYIATLI